MKFHKVIVTLSKRGYRVTVAELFQPVETANGVTYYRTESGAGKKAVIAKSAVMVPKTNLRNDISAGVMAFYTYCWENQLIEAVYLLKRELSTLFRKQFVEAEQINMLFLQKNFEFEKVGTEYFESAAGEEEYKEKVASKKIAAIFANPKNRQKG